MGKKHAGMKRIEKNSIGKFFFVKNKTESTEILPVLLVPLVGVEPTRYRYHGILRSPFQRREVIFYLF